MPEKFIRLPIVESRTGHKRSWLYREAAKGNFPAPVKVGARSSAWVESEVEAWIQAQILKSRERQ